MSFLFTVIALIAGKCNSHHCLLVGRSKIVLQGDRREDLEKFECFVGRQRQAEAGRGRQRQAEAGSGRKRQAEAGRGRQR